MDLGNPPDVRHTPTPHLTTPLFMRHPLDIADAKPALLTSRRHVARTAHTCCECLDIIQPGTVYEHVRGLWCRTWRTFKTCASCTELRHETNEGHAFLFEELAETIDEWWRAWQPSHNAPDRADKAALAPAVRRFRQRLRRSCKTSTRSDADTRG